MTVEILRSRVHHDIDAKFERALQVWRHESVVADDTCSGAMSYLADFFQIRNDHHRIGWRFQKHHLSVRLDRGLDVQRIRRVYKIELDVVVSENAYEETRGAAVGVVRHDDVIAGFNESQGGIDCGHA